MTRSIGSVRLEAITQLIAPDGTEQGTPAAIRAEDAASPP